MIPTKYPRTPHLPNSPSISNDDDVIISPEKLLGKEVVITEKMDGENTTMYRQHIHARSVQSGHHPSRAWVKGFHGSLAHHIPEGWRVCGENLFAKHSIFYDNLESYFLGFSVWDESNTALSWDKTLECFAAWGICAVPLLYRGVYSEKVLHKLIRILETNRSEGLVVRVAEAFEFSEFATCVGKWVRANHVQTTEHWKTAALVQNQLKRI
jgi:hypothetical protein